VPVSERFLARRKTFIVSASRTGTTFLGELLGSILHDCFSVHEPDTLRRNASPGRNLAHVRSHGGFANLVLLKALGRSGGRNLSLRRLAGSIDGEAARRAFVRERRWTDRLPHALYVESNQQLYGIAGDLADLPATRIVLLVRDPVTWVQSNAAYRFGSYGARDFSARVGVLGLKRLSPRHVGERAPDWDAWGQPRRLAWMWNFMNGRFAALRDEGRPNVALFRYEDVFVARDRTRIEEMARAIDSEADPAAIAERLLERMGSRVHASSDMRADGPSELTDADRAAIRETCASVMARLGYS